MPRPAKSNEQHRRDGTFRRGKHAPAAQQPLASLPAPPARLTSRDAKEAWCTDGGDLVKAKMLTRLDLRALADLCQAVGRMRACERDIEKHGMTYVNKDGEPRTHPSVTRLEKLHSTVLALQEKLGLTPASRQRLRVEPSGEEIDELDEFIAGGK
jgi:P27 family predicted phage terminase small subunit